MLPTHEKTGKSVTTDETKMLIFFCLTAQQANSHTLTLQSVSLL